jgi:hypothetical protein
MTDNEFTLSGLEKFAKYSVTVQAFNSRGDGPTSDAVNVQTLEDGEKVYYLELVILRLLFIIDLK